MHKTTALDEIMQVLNVGNYTTENLELHIFTFSVDSDITCTLFGVEYPVPPVC